MPEAQRITAPRDPRLHRYSMPTVALARRMYADGNAWNPVQIRDHLRAEKNAPDLSLRTVKRWVLPDYRERQLEWQRTCRQRKNASPDVDDQLPLDDQLLFLRSRGLSFPSIAVVAGVYHGLDVSGEQVRTRLHGLGVPKKQRKTRPARAERLVA